MSCGASVCDWRSCSEFARSAEVGTWAHCRSSAKGTEVVVANAFVLSSGTAHLSKKETVLQAWTARLSLYNDISSFLEIRGAYADTHNAIYVCRYFLRKRKNVWRKIKVLPFFSFWSVCAGLTLLLTTASSMHRKLCISTWSGFLSPLVHSSKQLETTGEEEVVCRAIHAEKRVGGYTSNSVLCCWMWLLVPLKWALGDAVPLGLSATLQTEMQISHSASEGRFSFQPLLSAVSSPTKTPVSSSVKGWSRDEVLSLPAISREMPSPCKSQGQLLAWLLIILFLFMPLQALFFAGILCRSYLTHTIVFSYS